MLARNGFWVSCCRWQASLTADATCPRCHDEDETVVHLFRGCSRVKPLWKRLVPERQQLQFFSSEVHVWILGNRTRNLLLGGSGDACLDFSLLLWAIWKARNNSVFNGAGFCLQ